jgi:Tfp pilus assembly protein PilV
MRTRSYSRSGISVVEVIVMLMILVIGLVGAFEIINETQQFANSTRLRIEAVNFARE